MLTDRNLCLQRRRRSLRAQGQLATTTRPIRVVVLVGQRLGQGLVRREVRTRGCGLAGKLAQERADDEQRQEQHGEPSEQHVDAVLPNTLDALSVLGQQITHGKKEEEILAEKRENLGIKEESLNELNPENKEQVKLKTDLDGR